ncbi:MAG: CAAX prenyl protease-related protein [Proteobacteria bacterium]|nr:CAAX prenyl protease-related protein [Pseudomonadota bacterium]
MVIIKASHGRGCNPRDVGNPRLGASHALQERSVIRVEGWRGHSDTRKTRPTALHNRARDSREDAFDSLPQVPGIHRAHMPDKFVPIAEELFFRGFVIRRCIGPDVDAVPVGEFTWLSFLLSSVAFGVLHGDAWVAGTVAGMLFALALYTRRRLDDAIVAHATTNALLSGYVVATGSWAQWG